MQLAPFLSAGFVTQFHLLLALFAFALGSFVLLRPKGSPSHRLLGRLWMGSMLVLAAGSFLITGHNGEGRLSWIHGLSAFVIAAVVIAIWAARTGRIRTHRGWVLGIYAGSFVGAGGAAFAPGRLISQILGYA